MDASWRWMENSLGQGNPDRAEEFFLFRALGRDLAVIFMQKSPENPGYVAFSCLWRIVLLSTHVYCTNRFVDADTDLSIIFLRPSTEIPDILPYVDRYNYNMLMHLPE